MTATRELVNLGEPRIDEMRARWHARAGLHAMTHPIA